MAVDTQFEQYARENMSRKEVIEQSLRELSATYIDPHATEKSKWFPTEKNSLFFVTFHAYGIGHKYTRTVAATSLAKALDKIEAIYGECDFHEMTQHENSSGIIA